MVTALNLINKSHEYRQLFIAFGQEWHVNEHGFQIVQAFTYEMYCAHTNTKLVNELRYEMFCVKKMVTYLLESSHLAVMH